MFNARVQQIIITELTIRGEGTERSPIRRVTEFWDFEGNKLAEVDPMADREKQPRTLDK
jgi:hypothetical protein